MNRRWIPFTAGLLLGLVLALGVAYADDLRVFKPKFVQEQTQPVVTMRAPAQPQVLESSDLAIRIQGRHGQRVVGTLMTKVDGKWVEVEFATRNELLKAK